MSVKEKFEDCWDRMSLQWKGMGITKFLPVFVCYILVPVIAYVIGLHDELNYKADIFWGQVMLFYPLMSAWWPVLMMDISLGADGELFSLYERNKWADVLVCYVAFLMLIAPMCSWMLNQWPDDIDPFAFWDLLSQCFVSVCLVYFLSCCFRSITLSYIVVLILSLFGRGGRVAEILGAFNIDSESAVAPMTFIVLGVICLILGKQSQELKA